ncbi:MAG: hypothetical protein KDE47_19690, partial [Caldilineaceae bacterium]|nr:hypothetical protein [Caldilineaceae bacterium]
MGQIRDFWLPELRSLGVKWVKVYNHDGAYDFVEALLAEGFCPILRIFRPHPNPGRLSIKDLVDVDTYVRIGVRYFEFNNEPDRDAEWKGGWVPANGIDIVVEDAIADIDAILTRGGMPSIPAVSCGSKWDLIGKIIEKGHRDLLEGPVWQAIHNYSRNRPLDYPYDLGNQEGAAYTQRFYRTLLEEQPNFDPWHGRSLSEINQMRRDFANPGATIQDDTACWLAYEFFNARNRRHLGRSIPILSTENGYRVGENTDPRYPATTPDLHMAQTLEACRVMMGVSQRFNPAPDYYFCTAFTLMVNQAVGSQSDWWESYAWYSNQWPDRVLPISKALRAEPKRLRRWQNSTAIGARVTLSGAVLQPGSNRTVVLDQKGQELARVTLDNSNRYRFPDLTPGSYIVRIADTDVMEAVTLTPEQTEFALDLDLSQRGAAAGESVVAGVVRGGAGAIVMLVRNHDGQEWVTMTQLDGAFRFVDLPAGTYSARVHPHGSRVDNIALDGENTQQIELLLAGWGYIIQSETIDSNTQSDGAAQRVQHQPGNVAVRPPDDDEWAQRAERTVKQSRVRCAVAGYKSLLVYAYSGEWRSETVETGSALALGEFACEIDVAGCPDDECTVTVQGVVDEEGEPVALTAYVPLNRAAIPFVRFTRQSISAHGRAAQSVLDGQVISEMEPGQIATVVLTDQQGNRRQQPTTKGGAFEFAYLEAGLYAVAVLGHETATQIADLALDGQNRVTVELRMPRPVVEPPAAAADGNGVIVGIIPGGEGKLAWLVDSVGNERSAELDADDQVCFDQLPADVYTLNVEGGYKEANLRIQGDKGVEVYFAPLVTEWRAEVSTAGSMPGFSAIRVEVAEQYDLPVYLSKEEWDGMVALTGSKRELGRFALEFSPLEPGYYIVEPAGLNVLAEVQLTGLEAVWVSFRQHTAPIRPNGVVPLGTARRWGRQEERAEPPAPESPDNIGNALDAGQVESPLPRLAAVEPIQRAWDGEEGVLDQPTPVGDEAHRDVVDPLAAESQENVDTSDFPPHESAQPTELIEEAEPTQTTNEKLEEIVEASH